EAGAERAVETRLRGEAVVRTLRTVVADVTLDAVYEVVHLPVVAGEGAADEAVGLDVRAGVREFGVAAEAVAEVNTGIGACPRGDRKFGDGSGGRRLFLNDVRREGGNAGEGDEPKGRSERPRKFEIGFHLFFTP